MLSQGKFEVLTYSKTLCKFGINFNLCLLKGLLLSVFSLGGFLSAYAESPISDAPILLAVAPVSDLPEVDETNAVEGETEQWSIHGQSTYIVQQKNNFN